MSGLTYEIKTKIFISMIFFESHFTFQKFKCWAMDNDIMTFMAYRCPRITNLNPGCQLVQDINDPCCKKPYCPPNVSPIVIKAPTPTTINGSPGEPIKYFKTLKYM